MLNHVRYNKYYIYDFLNYKVYIKILFSTLRLMVADFMTAFNIKVYLLNLKHS